MKMSVCAPENEHQKWGFINQRKRLVNAKRKMCLDRGNNPTATTPILYACDRVLSNRNQIWQFTNRADPPSQKDRNFHDDKTFPGRLYSNNDIDAILMSKSSNANAQQEEEEDADPETDELDPPGSVRYGKFEHGKCLGAELDRDGKTSKLGMYDCHATDDPDLGKFQFDVIW
eukprot:g7596.t1